MTIYSGQRPNAAELDTSGRLVAGWNTTLPSATFTTAETDLWTVAFTPPAAGTYRFEAITPYDGVSGEEAKYRLYVNGVEKRPGIARMRAGLFVDLITLWCVVDLTTTASVSVKVTGIRTSGSNAIQCRISPRELWVYKVERSASGLISA